MNYQINVKRFFSVAFLILITCILVPKSILAQSLFSGPLVGQMGSIEITTTQISSLRGGLNGWKKMAGAVQPHPDKTGIPSSTCNVKYVYDGSDYTRFRKQMAMNRNYNDAGFGGANNAAQSAIRAIRR